MQKRITRFSSLTSLPLCWLFIVWMVAFGSLPSALGQTKRNIKGRVADESNQSLVGVAVRVKGTNTGTVTDVSGQYTLAIGEATDVLVFSMIGMNTQEIPVGSQLVI